MKVSELKDQKLDIWVARALELPVEMDHGVAGFVNCFGEFYPLESYTDNNTGWEYAGPIIEREGIKLKGGIFEKWKADLKAPYYKYSMEGPTALIAAMRTFVASRFGVEVDDS